MTAAASLGPAATFMPSKRVNEVFESCAHTLHTREHDGVVYLEELRERGGEYLGRGRHGYVVRVVVVGRRDCERP